MLHYLRPESRQSGLDNVSTEGASMTAIKRSFRVHSALCGVLFISSAWLSAVVPAIALAWTPSSPGPDATVEYEWAEFKAMKGLSARAGVGIGLGLGWMSLGGVQAGRTATGSVDMDGDYRMRPYGYGLAACNGVGGLILLTNGIIAVSSVESTKTINRGRFQGDAFRRAQAKVQISSGALELIGGSAIIVVDVLLTTQQMQILDEVNSRNRQEAEDSWGGGFYANYQLTPAAWFPAVTGGIMAISGLIDLAIGTARLGTLNRQQYGKSTGSASRPAGVRWSGVRASYTGEELWIGTSFEF